MTLARYATAILLAISASILTEPQLQAQGLSAKSRDAQAVPAQPAALKSFDPALIEASQRLRLKGNVRPEVRLHPDLGPVQDSLLMEHVLLQLKRSPARQAEVDAYAREVTERGSANYHRWLSPEEFGVRFGVSEEAMGAVTGWLELHRLVVNKVYPNRILVDFSGTAAQIRETFQTEIHAYDVKGIRHIANNADPMIPMALAQVIEGIVSLHDFMPRPLFQPKTGYTVGTGVYATYPVTPPDLATIYNLTPLFKAGFSGKGRRVAVVEASDIHSPGDWTTFRSVFGLSGYTAGSLLEIHPVTSHGDGSCADPGAVGGWDEEAIVDAEYASAAAPDATIEVATCASTNATNGNLIALANAVNAGGILPDAISISYGSCEAENGATANSSISHFYQQATVEGIAVFAAVGDGGAAFCDAGGTVATDGIGVNAYASTAYNVAVGGTDFADFYFQDEGTYWNRYNTATGGSAKSYVPEVPWNDSCGNPLIAAVYGFKTTDGSSGFCFWDFNALDLFQTTTAGAGGPSGCASGDPAIPFQVSGTCAGRAKPSWQSVTGYSNDGVRDVPDVVLFAGDGVWGHYYIYCDSNLEDQDGAPCKGTSISQWSQGGGTSFAAPIMAGIQALVVQKWGREGNPNPVYYKIAGQEFISKTLATACNASNGVNSSSSCVFHDVTLGASAVNCEGAVNCYGDVLSTRPSAFTAAYDAHAGWDFSSGLGSVNAYNLVMNTGW